MKILHLTLTKKWFDMIRYGDKREEYREITDYWARRLLRGYKERMPQVRRQMLQDLKAAYPLRTVGVDPVRFEEVFFRNGYNPSNPSGYIRWRGLRVGIGKPEWGAPTYPVFIIELGDAMVEGGNHAD